MKEDAKMAGRMLDSLLVEKEFDCKARLCYAKKDEIQTAVAKKGVVWDPFWM